MLSVQFSLCSSGTQFIILILLKDRHIFMICIADTLTDIIVLYM